MTVYEVIDMVKKEKPNKFTSEHMVKWLNECEAAVQSMLGIPMNEWTKYEADDAGDENTSPMLIVPPPYDPLYVYWIKAKIDYANEEYEGYGNNQAQFQSFFDEFKIWAYNHGMVTGKRLPRSWKNVY